MRKFSLIILLTFPCCESKQEAKLQNKETVRRILADTTNNVGAQVEYEIYKAKKELCKKLCLYDLEAGTDSFELRLWIEPSMWEPHSLYILKGIDTSWLVYFYQYYQRHDSYETDADKAWDSFRNPRIESMIVKTLKPKKISWKAYLDILKLDSIWAYISQSEVKKYRGAVDGQSYSLEIADKHRYKFIHYNNPNAETSDSNHIRFSRFIENLIGPLFNRPE